MGAAVDLQLEAGGELFFTYEEPGTGRAELIGIGAAMLILLAPWLLRTMTEFTVQMITRMGTLGL